jgi:hypothetical protein
LLPQAVSENINGKLSAISTFLDNIEKPLFFFIFVMPRQWRFINFSDALYPL